MVIIDSSWPKGSIRFEILSTAGKGPDGIEVIKPVGFLKTKNYIYKKKDIISIGIVNEEIEKSKSFLGSAAGAGIGSLVLGPIGLIAGALASGNKKNKIVKIGIKFRDKNWILAEYNANSMLDKLSLNLIQKIELEEKKEAPF